MTICFREGATVFNIFWKSGYHPDCVQ